MGASFTKLFNALTPSREPTGLLMVGLDGSGKTTTLYKLKLGETVKTSVTIGVHWETLEYKNILFNVYDAGGQNVRLPLLKVYIDYYGVGALIYVVDSADRDCVGGLDRILDARYSLHMILNEDGLRGVPLLVMANKQDLPDAMDAEEVTDKLGLRSLPHPRLWHVQSTSAVTGEGLHEGLDWLASHVASQQEVKTVQW